MDDKELLNKLRNHDPSITHLDFTGKLMLTKCTNTWTYCSVHTSHKNMMHYVRICFEIKLFTAWDIRRGIGIIAKHLATDHVIQRLELTCIINHFTN
eukprot:TRINITY_DN1404_c0_g1_i1.p1 TRINITY_DN1404_c0_g1~~TRINITY_DN1404_c0_g1_i1.p1  ORF type:complete len:112 (-),score=2.27 TRINITY_DN1404_c0_g1_i1:264-554(-)